MIDRYPFLFTEIDHMLHKQTWAVDHSVPRHTRKIVKCRCGVTMPLIELSEDEMLELYFPTEDRLTQIEV